MRVVYLDSLVALNFLLDYLLLLLTGRVTGESLCRWRLALGGVLGCTYAGAAVLFSRWNFLLHPVTRVAVGVLMVLVSYGSSQRLLRLTAVFFALSAGLGGGLYALQLLGVGLESANGVVTSSLDLKWVLVFAAAAYCVFSVVGRHMARHGPRQLRQVVVRSGDRRVRLTALADSGNTLTDPMTGKGVVVAEGQRLKELLPPEADYRHPARCFPALREPGRFRLLPYRSVGVDAGLLLALRADSVCVDGKDLGSRLVALSPNPVSDGGGYQALVFEE